MRISRSSVISEHVEYRFSDDLFLLMSFFETEKYS